MPLLNQRLMRISNKLRVIEFYEDNISLPRRKESEDFYLNIKSTCSKRTSFYQMPRLTSSDCLSPISPFNRFDLAITRKSSQKTKPNPPSAKNLYFDISTKQECIEEDKEEEIATPGVSPSARAERKFIKSHFANNLGKSFHDFSSGGEES
eukprot:CAMPEP_0170487232 /NCGR_PEP_ID=MMETSP0208-20121228/6089_1 /TAXON_ID=197538 /ORGANISM="Strombidium inclinatum, Strain S3" /LENGTH=150 /DNA_ID=CAMNT_0010761451 /DNA_START=3533 /DNA_END=3981 /DNA_ORIENTATION=+